MSLSSSASLFQHYFAQYHVSAVQQMSRCSRLSAVGVSKIIVGVLHGDGLDIVMPAKRFGQFGLRGQEIKFLRQRIIDAMKPDGGTD